MLLVAALEAAGRLVRLHTSRLMLPSPLRSGHTPTPSVVAARLVISYRPVAVELAFDVVKAGLAAAVAGANAVLRLY